MRFDYQACYCEENILRLCGHEHLFSFTRRVVLISNQKRACPMWAVRAVGEGTPVVWDYHVVLAADSGSGFSWQIWDLDTSLGLPVDLSTWLRGSFRMVDRAYMPLFKVVDGALFCREFSSDRAHMRTQAGWQAPPPSWPAPYNGRENNLEAWLDMSNAGRGEVTDLFGLADMLDKSREPQTLCGRSNSDHGAPKQ